MTVEQLERLLYLTRLRQCVAIKPTGLGVGHTASPWPSPKNHIKESLSGI
ncbi:MAG: hypothetical protein ACJA1E_000011 [Paracoccaceae bacterium]|jgi:hypothetical protein